MLIQELLIRHHWIHCYVLFFIPLDFFFQNVLLFFITTVKKHFLIKKVISIMRKYVQVLSDFDLSLQAGENILLELDNPFLMIKLSFTSNIAPNES